MTAAGTGTLTEQLAAALAAGWRPLAAEEIDALAAADILSLGMVADAARVARRGRTTTFVRVATFEANEVTPDVTAIPAAAQEWRITGAPADLDAALRLVHELVVAPGRKPLSGFSLLDLEACAGADGRTLAEALLALRSAGLETVAFAPADDPAWLATAVGEARQAGLAIGRIGFDRPAADRLAQLRALAALGDVLVGIPAVAPLARRTSGSTSTGYDDVRAVALARLVLDKIPSVQVDWSVHGPKLAQVALTFGADDLDLVSPLDEVPEGRRRAPLDEVRRNISAAGFEPVERDGRYAPLD